MQFFIWLNEPSRSRPLRFGTISKFKQKVLDKNVEVINRKYFETKSPMHSGMKVKTKVNIRILEAVQLYYK